MAATKLELAEALDQARTRMDILRGDFNLRNPYLDLDKLYEDCDRLLQQIGLARIIEASLARQQNVGGAA